MKTQRKGPGLWQSEGYHQGDFIITTGKTMTSAANKFMAIIKGIKAPSKTKQAVSAPYSALSLRQREMIDKLLKVGATHTAIGLRINVSSSTVSREISRNSLSGEYGAEIAHNMAASRRTKATAYRQDLRKKRAKKSSGK